MIWTACSRSSWLAMPTRSDSRTVSSPSCEGSSSCPESSLDCPESSQFSPKALSLLRKLLACSESSQFALRDLQFSLRAVWLNLRVYWPLAELSSWLWPSGYEGFLVFSESLPVCLKKLSCLPWELTVFLWKLFCFPRVFMLALWKFSAHSERLPTGSESFPEFLRAERLALRTFLYDHKRESAYSQGISTCP